MNLGNEPLSVNHAELELLVLEAQQGSKKAYARLYERLNQPLLHFAYGICQDHALAQDAVQEAWVKMAKQVRRLKFAGAFRAWMYTRVRWQLLDALRRRGTQVDAGDVAEGQVEAIAQLEDCLDVRASLKRLPVIERQIIQLFYLDELSVAELAVVLDIPTGTVKSRLARARARLKQKFEPQTPQRSCK
ncbi:RNA polymerase sigma factor [Simiduia sp. 21SJ11W-1]|uniref:RNA polymerase sigma factor n=1 Tax=Simiduia sp. 21SJ11W-1 TaxID=2909669 RepID=UPI00209F20D2|nr:RNA polymerase sigma factor [Simiduia sp. 21SJ11W-1]UTA46707.1 RNA polymerase sigma factor [Simiduia sp. 21SJ11W-1]